MTVKIENENGKVTVKSPYNPNFPEEARKIGGKWTGKKWTFDQRDEERVRNLCIKVYGTDGTLQGLVDVQVRLCPGRISKHEIWALGREVIARPGRDAEVRMGEGVILLEGQFGKSGGSHQYPAIAAKTGTETDTVLLEIRDVPRQLVENFEHEHLELVKIIDHNDTVQVESDPLDAFTDATLIAALEKRGYTVKKENNYD